VIEVMMMGMMIMTVSNDDDDDSNETKRKGRICRNAVMLIAIRSDGNE
jgi:hypothetical protein